MKELKIEATKGCDINKGGQNKLGLQTNDVSIRETAKLFGWSTTKLYSFLRQIKNTPKKTAKKTLQNSVTTSKSIISLEVSKNKKTLEKTPKKTLEERKKEFGVKLIPYVEKYGKEIILEELAEQRHPERVEGVIFWALDEYSKRNKGKWGATIAHSIIERIKEEEETECVK